MLTIKLNANTNTIIITADGDLQMNTTPADLTTQQLASGSYESTGWVNYYSDAKSEIDQLIAHLPAVTRDEIEDLICDAECNDTQLMRIVKDDCDTVWVFTVKSDDLIEMAETELFN